MVKKVSGLVAPEERRQWLRDNLVGVCGWDVGFVKVKGSLGNSQIADLMWRDLGGKRPHDNTVGADVKVVRSEWEGEQSEFEVYSSDPLLVPERFAEWRSLCFSVKGGVPYETPAHQQAWAEVVIACALRDRPDAPRISDRTVRVLGLPADVNEGVLDSEGLVSLFLLGPPRHGKTDLLIHVILWLICKDRTINIMYSNGPKGTTETAMDWIRNQLEENEVLVERWGPFRDKSCKWSANELQVLGRASKGRTVYGFGTRGGVLSRDADLIILDDPMGSAEGVSEQPVDTTYSWVKTGVMTRREPETALIGVGSHLPNITGDLWSRVEDDLETLAGDFHKVIMVKSQAHDPSKCESPDEGVHLACMLWPSKRPYPWLMSMKDSMDGDMFEAVYNQQPRNPETDFFPATVLETRFEPGVKDDEGKRCLPYRGGEPGVLDSTRSWGVPPRACCDWGLRWGIGVDPAPGGRSGRGSYNAIIVRAACGRCGRSYYVDYGEQRMSVERIPDWIKGYVISYPQVQLLTIEINAYQKALARDTTVRRLAADYGFRIEEWRTDERKNDPELGVPVLGRRMRQGHASIPARHAEDRARGRRLIQAFKRWPGTPDDLPMADWLCEMGLVKLLKRQKAAFRPGTVMPGHHTSEYWAGNVLTYTPTVLANREGFGYD